MPNTIIDVMRHGEPEGGRAYRGHGVDDPLSAKGWAQMWATVGDKAPWSVVVSSPLVRCRAFAQALVQRHGLQLAVDDRFKEVGFGVWEGRTPEQLKAEDPAQYQAFYDDPVCNRPPGAEPLAAFQQRVSTAYEELLRQYAGQHVLVVAHAGVIRAMIAHVLEASPRGLYRIAVANAGITRLRHDARGGMLEFHNGALP